MKNRGQFITYIIYILLGGILVGISLAEIVDEFWSGMGATLILIGIIRLLRMYRLSKNAEYQEKVEIELKDERNAFIRNKAWAWTGYLFILFSAIMVIVFKVVGQEMLSMVASGTVCIIVIIYWCSYWMLKRKY